MITLLWGQPGTGKSTLATGIALDYMAEGRRVVSNYAIDPAPASMTPNGKLAHACCEVIPARPRYATIQNLGIGWRDPQHVGREDVCGLLLIDEAGPWLDSRKWNDGDRAQIIDWLLQSRKRGWDVLLIAQAPGLVDKQVREAVIECYARCRRTDRMRVPLVGWKVPRFHIAVAKYGLEPGAPVLQRWIYRGSREHACYQSYALFDAENAGQVEHYVVPPPSITKWANHKPWYSKFKDAWLQREERKVPMLPKHPVVEELAKLSELEAIRHWKRFDALGVFDRNPAVDAQRKAAASMALAAEDRAIRQREDADVLSSLRLISVS